MCVWCPIREIRRVVHGDDFAVLGWGGADVLGVLWGSREVREVRGEIRGVLWRLEVVGGRLWRCPGRLLEKVVFFSRNLRVNSSMV